MSVSEMHTETLHSAEDVCGAVGITYRILDYWLRKGYIVIENDAHGSGSHRRFTDDELDAVRKLFARYEAIQADLAEIADGTAWSMIRMLQLKGNDDDEPTVRERHPSARRTG